MNGSLPWHALRFAADPDAHDDVMARVLAAANKPGMERNAFVQWPPDDAWQRPNALGNNGIFYRQTQAHLTSEGRHCAVGFVDST